MSDEVKETPQEEAPNLPAKVTAAPSAVTGRGIQLRDLNELWRFARIIQVSGLAPKGMERPETIVIAIEMGLELGLAPLSALQNIAVINGRPSVWGDALPALVYASGKCEYIHETMEGDGEARRAICISKRKGSPEAHRTEFSVSDAKKAKLWGKDGPWSQYPDRMLRMRARSFNLRDNFADALRGVRTAEEVQDYIDAEVVTLTPGEAGEPAMLSPVEPAAAEERGTKTERVKERLKSTTNAPTGERITLS